MLPYLELIFLIGLVGAEIFQKSTTSAMAGVVLVLGVVAKRLLRSKQKVGGRVGPRESLSI